MRFPLPPGRPWVGSGSTGGGGSLGVLWVSCRHLVVTGPSRALLCSPLASALINGHKTPLSYDHAEA